MKPLIFSQILSLLLIVTFPAFSEEIDIPEERGEALALCAEYNDVNVVASFKVTAGWIHDLDGLIDSIQSIFPDLSFTETWSYGVFGRSVTVDVEGPCRSMVLERPIITNIFEDFAN